MARRLKEYMLRIFHQRVKPAIKTSPSDQAVTWFPATRHLHHVDE